MRLSRGFTRGAQTRSSSQAEATLAAITVRPACHQAIGQWVGGRWVTAPAAGLHVGCGAWKTGAGGGARGARDEGTRDPSQPGVCPPTGRLGEDENRGPSRGHCPRRGRWSLGGPSEMEASAGGSPGWRGPCTPRVTKVHAPSVAGHLSALPAFSRPLGQRRRPGCHQTPSYPLPALHLGGRGWVGGAGDPGGPGSASGPSRHRSLAPR